MTTEQIIAIARHQAMHAEQNLEYTLFIQLTRREIWLVLYGLLWSSQIEPRLEDTSCNLLEKLSEVLDTQKPQWRTRKDGGAAA